MNTTPNLLLPLLAAAQAQKHVTHNEALVALDGLVQLAVANRSLTAAPANPAEGDRHIVNAGATGAWAGWDHSIALYSAGAWLRLQPRAGWRAWVAEESMAMVWDGAAWQPEVSEVNQMSLIGVNTAADATNRLAVKSDAVLLSHDDVTPGSGDIRIAANKAAPGRTASMVFETGWSGRAELGLAGTDTFSIKVSSDGANWIEALTIDPASGAVTMPATSPSLKVLTAEDTSGTSMPNLTYVDQLFAVTTRNDFGAAAWNGTVFTAPEAGTYDLGTSLAVEGAPSSTSAYFLKNETVLLGFSEITGAAGQNTILAHAVVTLAAGDTIRVRMRHNDGASQSGLSSAIYSIIRL